MHLYSYNIMLKFCISIRMITCFLLLKQKQNLYRIQCIYTVLKDLLIPVERLVIAFQTNMISLTKLHVIQYSFY